MKGCWLAGLALTTAAVAVAPAAATGQELARWVSEVENGTAILSYPAGPEVEICDRGIRMGGDRISWHFHPGHDGPGICEHGPVRVELRVREGRVRNMNILKRMEPGREGALELGQVPARVAADLFLDLARTGGPSHRGLEEAVFPLALADVAEIWRDLLGLAKDGDVASDSRSAALFWVSQQAADAATEGLAEVAMDEEEDQGVRDAAVFALSQRPEDEAVPILMELARTAEQAQTRRAAMFWLAQTEDDRVVAFFEEILLGWDCCDPGAARAPGN